MSWTPHYPYDCDVCATSVSHEHLINKGFQFLGDGRHRRSYLFPNKRWVLKVPLAEDGMEANKSEAQIYASGNPYAAKCRLFEYNGIPCLIMEALNLAKIEWDKIFTTHPWTRYVDCVQVGINRKGNIVAYDYALIDWDNKLGQVYESVW